MSDDVPIRSAQTPVDTITPRRDITHAHFAPGDQVMIVQGKAGRRLFGATMTVVTPSWHTSTDEDGWRLRDPAGGQRTFITGHPRYLVHLARRCGDCLLYLRVLEDYLLPRLPGQDIMGFHWYSVTELNQLVHIADQRGSG